MTYVFGGMLNPILLVLAGSGPACNEHRKQIGKTKPRAVVAETLGSCCFTFYTHSYDICLKVGMGWG